MTTSDRTPARVDGTHLVVEYSECDRSILDDDAAVESLLVKAAESIGATVVASVFHRFRPSGVTGCVILAESHLTIHTWPQSRYASVDLYTSRDCDPHRVHDVLEKGLRPQTSQVVVVDRGSPGPKKMCLHGYREVASYTLDCRSPQLPDGIRVGLSPGRGFGLFATRDFANGELIYDTPGTLAEWDAEFIVEHDVGRSVHDADSLGYQLSTELIDIWPEQIRDAIGRHFGLKNPSLKVLHQNVTDDHARQMLITAFDGLKNHANDPNTVMDWSAATIEFDEEGTPRWSIPTIASKPIKSGEEMFVDYRTSLFAYLPPNDWLP